MNFKSLRILLLAIFAMGMPFLHTEEKEYNIHSLNLFTPTNRSFKVMVNGTPLFLRIGRDNPEQVGIDRAREITYLKVGETLGLTPALLGYELDNGLLMTEFIEGTTPDAEKMHDLQFLQKVVANLRKLHAYPTNNAQAPEKTMFDACRHFYHSVTAGNVTYDEESVTRWMKFLHSFEDGYYKGIDKAVCHGDLYHGNLLEASDGTVYLIDWEYSFFGYAIDDLGKLCSDDLTDEEIQHIVKAYWGSDKPDMFRKLKQNVFMHELVHYFWCLLQANNAPKNAPQYYKRAQLMQNHLNLAAG